MDHSGKPTKGQTQLLSWLDGTKNAGAKKSKPEIETSSPKERVQSSPILLDGEEKTIGTKDHQAVFKEKILQKYSSVFFKDPIKKIDKLNADAYRLEAANYPVIRTSIVVRCKDGPPLLYFIKGGMLAGLSLEEQKNLPNGSMHAIKGLVQAYPPNQPKVNDSRLSENGEAQRERHESKKQAWGRYHFVYWHGQGQPNKPAVLSSESMPNSEEQKKKVLEYMQATAWEHNQVAKWISVLDPEVYQELHDRYQELGSETLKHLYQGPDACHPGLVLLANVAVDPHKDRDDARESWTSTNCWFDFKGGYLGFPDLGIKIAQEAGDLVLSHAAVLTHFVEEIEDGERYCHVRFTKKGILRPKTYFPENISCPVKGCTKVCTSMSTLMKHLKGPSGARRRAARKDLYHFLDNAQIRLMLKEAVKAYKTTSKNSTESSST